MEAQAGLKLLILLLQTPECWDCTPQLLYTSLIDSEDGYLYINL
jgi:hypothetical protein